MMGYVRRFFDKRAPRADSFTLTVNKIYVFFSRQGILFAFLLLITFVAGVNYGNNLILGLFFYLLSIWVVSAIVTFLQLFRLQFALKDISLTECGELAWVTLAVANGQGKAVRQLYLAFDDKRADDKVARHVLIGELDKEVLVRLPVATHRRGRLVLPRLTVKSVYPLGIVQAWSYGFFAQTGWVYPTPQAFDAKTSLAYAYDDKANQGAYQKGQDEFDALGQYVEGESLARVSWSHVARGAGMLTKQFADPIGNQTVFDYGQMPASHHEGKLSELAHLVLAAGDTPFCLVLPSGAGQFGVGQAFIQQSLIRLAQEP